MEKYLKAIIVDAHEVFRRTLKEFLMDLNVDVIAEVDSVPLALEIIRLLKTDIVFMDIGIPEFNGISTCKTIKSLPNKVKVVLYTIYATKNELEEINNMADGFIFKDNIFDELPKLMRKLSK